MIKITAIAIGFIAITVAITTLIFDNPPVDKSPKDRLRLVSPDGKSSLYLFVTNDGPVVWLTNGKTGETISIVALSDFKMAVIMKDKDDSSIVLGIENGDGPYIQMCDKEKAKTIKIKKEKIVQ